MEMLHLSRAHANRVVSVTSNNQVVTDAKAASAPAFFRHHYSNLISNGYLPFHASCWVVIDAL